MPVMSDPTAAPEYFLGTDQAELARLALQHRLWADAAHAAWRLGRIGPAARVLDVGCGPGHASMDLGGLVTPSGAVVGVDESAGFVDWLNEQAAQRGMAHVRAVVSDVQRMNEALPQDRGGFDAAYARWVLCYVARPEAVVASVAALLKPGGRFIAHDYFNYDAMTLAPPRASHDRAVAATVRRWRERGGDPDIAGRLPRLCEAAGLRPAHVSVHQRVLRGHPDPTQRDPMWAWPLTWWRSFVPKLVQIGHLSPEDGDAVLADLDEVSCSETDFMVLPAVYEVVAVKA
jgi:ubiquinone/menaquinone biosynthesis C-methylase UbiE